MDEQTLLRAYDQQLRTDAETQNALSVTHLGLLHLVTLDGGWGFVTYPHPDDAEAAQIPHLVPRVLDTTVRAQLSPRSSGRPAIMTVTSDSIRHW
jgi:hypothetical protein